MFNKNYFILKDEDSEKLVESIKLTKEILSEIIKTKPTFTVTEYIKYFKEKSKEYDGLIEKYYFHYYTNMSDQISETVQKFDELYNLEITPFYQSQEYFDFIQSLTANTEEEKTYKDKILKVFIKSGLHLSDEDKKKFINLNIELSDLSVSFAKNISDSHKNLTYNLTDDLKEKLTKKELSYFENGVLKYNENIFTDILQESKCSEFRKIIYKLKQSVGLDNTSIIKNIVEKKQQKAKILGYKNYAELSLENKMAKNPEIVKDFLLSINKKVLPKAKQERKAYEDFIKNKFNINKIDYSDEAYYGNLYKEMSLSFEKDAERKYLPFNESLISTFELIKKMLGITFEKVDFFDLPFKDMETYKVYNDGKFKGYMILDLYYREVVKHQGAWVSSIESPSREDLGIVSLCCNFDKTKDGMSFDDLTTLLHEFGHLTHYFSSNTEFSAHSGTGNLAHDAVEIPSQMLEKYSSNKEFLDSIVKKTSLGLQELPIDIYEKILKLERFSISSFYTRQISFGLLDILIYNEEYKSSIKQLYLDITEKYTTKRADENTNFPNVFSHIFDGGYSAGYYGYMWSDVYSIDAFVYINKSIEEHSKDYKEKFLSKGGSEDAFKIYNDFRGSLANPDSLLEFYGII